MTATPEERWRLIRSEVLKQHPEVVTNAKGGLFVGADSRTMLRAIPDGTIDCIVTSPPYGSQKDYGSSDQIGFGQKMESEYLRDLGGVLHELFRASKVGAAMWVVLDTVKRSGRTLVLPLEVIKRADDEGWSYHDLVIWDKGRSLPWSHPGHFRGVFEYILLFSKGQLARFALDRVRETDHLSSYWVKYPERFNPSGKAPSDLWHFPIPVQGSWSKRGIRHFCPFPLPMVARMINLTSDKGEVVVDPFAGTGSVVAVATFLGRRALGIDVNQDFAKSFAVKGRKALLDAAKTELGHQHRGANSNGLGNLVVRLRMLKYPKSLYGELLRPDRLGDKATLVAGFVVTQTSHNSNGMRTLGGIALNVLLEQGADKELVREAVASVVVKPPLSKFGLEVSVKIVTFQTWHSKRFLGKRKSHKWYLYVKGAFHKYSKALPASKLHAALRAECGPKRHRVPPIFAPIAVDVPLMILG